MLGLLIETVGNAQIDTGVKKFGTGSMKFDGTGDYLFSPSGVNFNMLTGDFTVEAWVYGPAQASYAGIMGGASTPSGWTFRLNNSGHVVLTNGSTTYSSSPNTVPTNTWTHVAVSRSQTTLKIFINGTEVNSSSSSDAIDFSGGGFQVGRGFTVDGNDGYFSGYIDELRITKGIARYTTNFTPPSAPFADQ